MYGPLNLRDCAARPRAEDFGLSLELDVVRLHFPDPGVNVLLDLVRALRLRRDMGRDS